MTRKCGLRLRSADRSRRALYPRIALRAINRRECNAAFVTMTVSEGTLLLGYGRGDATCHIVAPLNSQRGPCASTRGLGSGLSPVSLSALDPTRGEAGPPASENHGGGLRYRRFGFYFVTNCSTVGRRSA